MSYQKFTVGEQKPMEHKGPPSDSQIPHFTHPAVTWAAPYQQCSHGTAGHGGNHRPAGRESHPLHCAAKPPGPGSNWGTGQI